MTKKLKPCPFCGVEADTSRGLHKYDCWGVYCPTCKVQTTLYPTEREAIKAWNTRAEPEDYLKEIYNWAHSCMECCDEPEWSLFTGITNVIAKYWRETSC